MSMEKSKSTDKPRCNRSYFKCLIIFLLLLVLPVVLWLQYNYHKQDLLQLANEYEQALAALKSESSEKEQQIAKQLNDNALLIQAVASRPVNDESSFMLAEIAYLLQLADYQMQYERNISSADILMARIESLLNKMATPGLEPLSASVFKTIADLKVIVRVDPSQLILRLMNLEKQISHLSLMPREGRLPTEQLAIQKNTSDHAIPYWREGLQTSWDTLRHFVVVRRLKEPVAPLISPEQRLYLNQNLHAMFSQARWAVLHHQQTIYVQSLNAAMDWIEQYFQQDSPVTTSMLEQIKQLIQINVQPTLPDLSEAKALLDSYMKQRLAKEKYSFKSVNKEI